MTEHVTGNPLGKINESNEAQLRSLLMRRCAHQPLDKLLGYRDFYKNRFTVSEAVLSPRPDTEVLVEAAIEIIKQKAFTKVLDLGTGSGCIVLSILDDCADTTAVAVDKSMVALDVARKNGDNLKLAQRIDFINASWFDEDFSQKIGSGYEVIVSNPPYIPSADIADLEEEVKAYDPLSALDGGEDGYDHYQKIAELAPELLVEGGYLFLEAGINQAEKIAEIFEEQGLALVKIIRDLAGIERCVILKK